MPLRLDPRYISLSEKFAPAKPTRIQSSTETDHCILLFGQSTSNGPIPLHSYLLVQVSLLRPYTSRSQRWRKRIHRQRQHLTTIAIHSICFVERLRDFIAHVGKKRYRYKPKGYCRRSTDKAKLRNSDIIGFRWWNAISATRYSSIFEWPKRKRVSNCVSQCQPYAWPLNLYWITKRCLLENNQAGDSIQAQVEDQTRYGHESRYIHPTTGICPSHYAPWCRPKIDISYILDDRNHQAAK